MKSERVLLFCFILSIVSSAGADDAWFVDTRSAMQSRDAGIEHLAVHQLAMSEQDRLRWTPATANDFLESHEPEKPLVIIIHGNWMPLADAKAHGIAFQRLVEKMGNHRLLVWSWPSERTDLPVRQDALLKAKRADVQAHFLAAFLRKLQPGSKVSLVGFSFGAKLACETLQLLADTAEDPFAEDGKVGHGLELRTVLLSAAMDRQALLPGRKYGLALSSTEKMLIHVNPDDSKLRWYPLLVGCGGPKALGREGVILGGAPPEYVHKVRSRNVQKQIGCDHAFMKSLLAFLAYRDDFRHYALFL